VGELRKPLEVEQLPIAPFSASPSSPSLIERRRDHPWSGLEVDSFTARDVRTNLTRGER